jgi:hypothetical protein
VEFARVIQKLGAEKKFGMFSRVLSPFCGIIKLICSHESHWWAVTAVSVVVLGSVSWFDSKTKQEIKLSEQRLEKKMDSQHATLNQDGLPKCCP